MDNGDKKETNGVFDTPIKPGVRKGEIVLQDVFDTDPIKPGHRPRLRLKEVLTNVVKSFGALKKGGQ